MARQWSHVVDVDRLFGEPLGAVFPQIVRAYRTRQVGEIALQSPYDPRPVEPQQRARLGTLAKALINSSTDRHLDRSRGDQIAAAKLATLAVAEVYLSQPLVRVIAVQVTQDLVRDGFPKLAVATWSTPQWQFGMDFLGEHAGCLAGGQHAKGRLPHTEATAGGRIQKVGTIARGTENQGDVQVFGQRIQFLQDLSQGPVEEMAAPTELAAAAEKALGLLHDHQQRDFDFPAVAGSQGA